MRSRDMVLVAAAVTILLLVVVGSILTTPSSVTIAPAGVTVSTPVTPSFSDSPYDRVPPNTPSVESARDLLATMPRQEPLEGLPAYARDSFGRTWADPDRNGCNGREDALAGWVDKKATAGACVVSGSFEDPYTDSVLTIPNGIDMDHVVPLKQAWLSGAYRWDDDKRIAFANDPGNLIPVSASANRSKGAKTPDQWMPPDPTYWCEYARAYIGNKSAYSLTITHDEGAALATGLDTCGPERRDRR